MAREAAVAALTEEIGKKLVEKFGEEKVTEFVAQGRLLLHPEGSGPRLDHEPGQAVGRARPREVRPIYSEVGVLPRAHGSACSSAGKPRP